MRTLARTAKLLPDMGDADEPSWRRIIWGLLESVGTFFSVGFTVIAMLTYFGNGAVDFSRALIVGAALALFQIARFAFDVVRDVRDRRQEVRH